jgi:hypothetical protein
LVQKHVLITPLISLHGNTLKVTAGFKLGLELIEGTETMEGNVGGTDKHLICPFLLPVLFLYTGTLV